MLGLVVASLSVVVSIMNINGTVGNGADIVANQKAIAASQEATAEEPVKDTVSLMAAFSVVESKLIQPDCPTNAPPCLQCDGDKDAKLKCKDNEDAGNCSDCKTYLDKRINQPPQ